MTHQSSSSDITMSCPFLFVPRKENNEALCHRCVVDDDCGLGGLVKLFLQSVVLDGKLLVAAGQEHGITNAVFEQLGVLCFQRRLLLLHGRAIQPERLHWGASGLR